VDLIEVVLLVDLTHHVDADFQLQEDAAVNGF